MSHMVNGDLGGKVTSRKGKNRTLRKYGPQEGVQLTHTSTRRLPKARLLHREPPVPSCQKILFLDGIFSGEAYAEHFIS